MTTSTSCVQMKAKYYSPSTGIASWNRIDTTWMRCATLGPVMPINRNFDISSKLDISRNLSTFPSQLHLKANWSFATPTQPVAMGSLWWAFSPSATKLQSLRISISTKTMMFVQIYKCQAPLHKCKPLALRRFCCHTKLFNIIANSLVRMVRF